MDKTISHIVKISAAFCNLSPFTSTLERTADKSGVSVDMYNQLVDSNHIQACRPICPNIYLMTLLKAKTNLFYILLQGKDSEGGFPPFYAQKKQNDEKHLSRRTKTDTLFVA